ncbi:hypothetical protein KDL45_12715 [bacterium]|nr:hypothetical protein [bacterium]
MKLYERIRDIDRRIIYLFMAIAVILPLIFTVRFPEYPAPMVQKTFDAVENLEPGSRILISFDYDPGSEPELQPMATAWVRHAVEKGHKLVIMALWPLGQEMATNTIAAVKADLKAAGSKKRFEDGLDYVNLGYKTGNYGVINVALTDLLRQFPADVKNVPTATIPVMKGIKSLKDFDLMVSVSAGLPGLKEWIQFGSDPAGVPIIGGNTAVQAPLMYPYYPKQLSGLLGGLKAAAEYETLLGKKYPQYADVKLNKGRIRMGAQTIAHIVIMLFIVIGNITYFIDRRRGEAR